VITSFQKQVSQAFFELPESAGFVVVGGAALIASGLVDRETTDVDLFTSKPPSTPMRLVAAALRRTSEERGWSVRQVHESEMFARIMIGDGAEELIVDLGIDSPPERPPSVTVLGPTLAPDDLAARKVLTLFGRAEPRDFVDVYWLSRHFSRAQLQRWAEEQDKGFDRHMFAEMIELLGRVPDRELLAVTDEVDQVRAFFTKWRRDIAAGGS
jgi:hypothetical protein